MYRTKTISIPAPRFVIFYNGEEEQPESQILRLSNMYTVSEEEHALELEAIMLNINPGYNEALQDSCKTLRDYSTYTSKVRKYAKRMTLDAAVELAITECIAADILRDFLQENRAEAKKVSIYEYDEEKHMRQEREASREEGLAEGKRRAENTLKLVKILMDAGRMEDLKKVTEDSEFCEKMFEEFNLN